MPGTRSRERLRLTDKQRRFVQEFLKDGNATAAAQRAGYGPNRTAAATLTKRPAIRAALEEAHTAAEVATGKVLRDWKELAPAAQHQVERISQGVVPSVAGQPEVPMISLGRDGAAVAKVMLDACREILERGYPKKLQLEHSGEVRSGVLAVPLPVAQQDWDALAKLQQERLERVGRD